MKTTSKLMTTITMIILLNVTAFSQLTFDYDKSVDFTKYKTYSFLDWQKDSDKILNDIDKQRLRNAFQNEFSNRNIKLLEKNGDMLVAIYVVVDNKQSVTAYTTYTGGFGYGLGRPFGVGAIGVGANTTFNDYDYQEGTLILDCYDEISKKLMWQGVYKGVVADKPQKREKTIPKHVKAMMKKYPIQPIKK